MNQVVPMQDAARPKSVVMDMADRFGMEPQAFEATLRATVVPEKTTAAQFAAFLLVAKEYELNPLTKEIYAFPTRAGGIQPIVSIDGWMNLINSHRGFDGMEFEDVFDDDGKLKAITCRMFRKDRSHPTSVTEYMSECVRGTDTWRQWPARMLRHKAAIQCARYAFGFSGLVDEDEFDRMKDVTPPPPPPPPAPRDAAAIEPPKPNPGPRGPREPVAPRDPEMRAAFDMQAPPAEATGAKDAQVADHDPDTGEVIEGEVDADSGEPLDVPAWLEELDTMMAGARDGPDLEQVWKDYSVPNKAQVSSEDWREAEKVYERHSTRLKL